AFQRDIIEREKTFHPVGDVATTQSRAADVLDIPIQFQLRLAGLAYELGTPVFITNFASLGFAIIHHLNLFDRAIGIQADCVGDKLVFADDFIDDEPAATAHAPDLLLIVQHAHAAGLLNSFALSRSQFHWRGGQRFARKNRALRL